MSKVPKTAQHYMPQFITQRCASVPEKVRRRKRHKMMTAPGEISLALVMYSVFLGLLAITGLSPTLALPRRRNDPRS